MAAGRSIVKDVRGTDVFREADRVILARYAPACVLVTEDLDILQFRGQTGAYLDPAPGQPSLNLLRMAREGLAFHLRSAVREARKRGEPVRKEGVLLESNGSSRAIDLEVIPVAIQPSTQRFFLLVFEEGPPPRRERRAVKAHPETTSARGPLAYLKRELAAARSYREAISEEQEASNEELRSANEEILAANEELQSANEELEASKEELRSSNVELSQTNSDLINVLSSVNIPIVILGPDLRIRHFTAMAEEVLNLTPDDVGRRIIDRTLNIAVPDLERLIVEACASNSNRERTVQDNKGCWYYMRIHPCGTSEDRIDGSVLAFVEIDELERSRRSLQESESFARAIVETIRDGLLILDRDSRVKWANRSFYDMFQVSAGETEGRRIQELGPGRWDIPEVLEKIRSVIASGTSFEDLEVITDVPGVGRKTMILSGRGFAQDSAPTNAMLLVIRDISRRRRTERVIGELSGRLLQQRDEVQRQIARELHDSTGQSLSGLAMNLTLLGEFSEALPPKARQVLTESLSLAEGCARELHDLAALLHSPLIEEVGLVAAVRWIAETFSRRTGIQVYLEALPDPGELPLQIKMTVFRVVQECLTNVQRHSGSPAAWVRIERTPAGVEVSVRDAGRGIERRAESADGLPSCVGIIGMRERVRQVGGDFDIATGAGGTTVKAFIPLPADAS